MTVRIEVTCGATQVEIAVWFSSLEKVMQVFRKCCHCVPFIFWISKYKSKMGTFQLSV